MFLFPRTHFLKVQLGTGHGRYFFWLETFHFIFRTRLLHGNCAWHTHSHKLGCLLGSWVSAFIAYRVFHYQKIINITTVPILVM